FLMVNRTGTLGAAARQLHCVPSNVSARLRQLEEQLNAALFMRRGQRLRLTPAGERLLPYAEQLEELCQAAWRSVHTDELAGNLRLGAMETTAAVWLPEALARFHRDAPRVNLTLATGTSRHLIEQVLAGELDAALIAGAPDHPGLIEETVWHEELMLVLPPGISPDNLTEAPVCLIGFAVGCHYRERLERWSQQAELKVSARQNYGSVEAILGSIAAGMGVGLLPRSLLEQHPRAPLVKAYHLPPAIADTPTRLVRRRDAPEHPALNLLMEQLAARCLTP
ncbi:LysR substrate-binding domain-containing protein, partial [Alkalilimnicola ehrlichii]